jgi:hypothetical protein
VAKLVISKQKLNVRATLSLRETKKKFKVGDEVALSLNKAPGSMTRG